MFLRRLLYCSATLNPMNGMDGGHVARVSWIMHMGETDQAIAAIESYQFEPVFGGSRIPEKGELRGDESRSSDLWAIFPPSASSSKIMYLLLPRSTGSLLLKEAQLPDPPIFCD